MARPRRREGAEGCRARGDGTDAARSRSRRTSSWPRSPPSSTSRTGSRSCVPDDIATRIWPLPPRKINGIGPKASEQARRARHQDHRRARACRPRVAHRALRAQLRRVAARASRTGDDDREVVTESEPVSISRETTFDRDLSARRDRAELSEIFTDLCVRLAGDLTRKGYVGRTVGIKLRFDNFKTVTRDRTIERADAGRADDPARGRRMPEARAARAAHPAARRAHRLAVAAHRRRLRRPLRCSTDERPIRRHPRRTRPCPRGWRRARARPWRRSAALAPVITAPA